MAFLSQSYQKHPFAALPIGCLFRAMDWIKEKDIQPDQTAIISGGRSYSYAELHAVSDHIALALLNEEADLNGARIAMMFPPSFEYVATQWGIWKAGGVAVPLALSYPTPELKYIIETVSADHVIYAEAFEENIFELALEVEILSAGYSDIESMDSDGDLPFVDAERAAMILFTSGTTSKPKGVVISHRNIAAQVRSLSQAWGWQQDDHILNVLPLHHVHGITNVLCCALHNGACCEFMPFEAAQVWQRFAQGGLSLFMAVPTIYSKLVQHFTQCSSAEQARLTKACASMRLMVSGSAALPVSVLEEWQSISGHRLLERYGMTEIGMGLSNPLEGERRAGHVGQPLPGVEIRLVDAEMQDVVQGEQGEILVRGDHVFSEYWERAEATAEAFVKDDMQADWFRTGDMAVLQDDYYRILGRSSVDILKSGGYKISALEIEEVFRQHPEIRDCAVVGIPDTEWGELIAMAIVADAEPDGLLDWGRTQLAPYKLPRRLLLLSELPRNALGKVVKPQLKLLFG